MHELDGDNPDGYALRHTCIRGLYEAGCCLTQDIETHILHVYMEDKGDVTVADLPTLVFVLKNVWGKYA